VKKKLGMHAIINVQDSTISLVFVLLNNATFLEHCGLRSPISTTVNSQPIADNQLSCPFRPVLKFTKKGKG